MVIIAPYKCSYSLIYLLTYQMNLLSLSLFIAFLSSERIIIHLRRIMKVEYLDVARRICGAEAAVVNFRFHMNVNPKWILCCRGIMGYEKCAGMRQNMRFFATKNDQLKKWRILDPRYPPLWDSAFSRQT